MATQLTDLNRVKRYAKINIDEDSDDDILNNLLSAVSEEIRQYCQQDFDLALFEEVYNGSGNAYIQLSQSPVHEVRSLTVAGQSVSESPDGMRPGFVIEDRALMNAMGRWPSGLNIVRVAYVAGYLSVPEDVQEACAYVTALRYKKRESLGLTSKASGNGSNDTFDPTDLPSHVQQVLHKYIEVGMVVPNRCKKTSPPPTP